MASRTLVAKALVCPTASSARPNAMSAARSCPPSAIRILELSAQAISKRMATSSSAPRAPNRLNTALMRVRGTPTRLASSMTRDADVADDTAASPTTRQRSLAATAAATASPQKTEVSIKTTSDSRRRTSSSSSTGRAMSSACSGAATGPQSVTPGATRIDVATISGSVSVPAADGSISAAISRGASTPNKS